VDQSFQFQAENLAPSGDIGECPLKVNDAVGNPIDIGAVIVWRVEDAAKALLEVGSYANYVKAQSETALRRMASVTLTIWSRPTKR
jgi:hypothetical protein